MIFKLQYFKLWRNYGCFFYIRFIWASASGYFPILTYDFLVFGLKKGSSYIEAALTTHIFVFNCVGECFWHQLLTKPIKNMFEKKNLNCDSLPHNIYKIYEKCCLNKWCTINPRMGIKLNSTMLKKLKVTLINTKVNWWDRNTIHTIIL